MKLVYLPLVNFKNCDGPYIVLDANGWPVELTNCQIDLVDRRPCAIVEWLEVSDGLHRVRIGGGHEILVRPHASWKYVPFGGEPIAELSTAV